MNMADDRIGGPRFPRARVVLELSEPVIAWLRQQAREDKQIHGTSGKPSVSAVVERIVRRGGSE